jgi:hypothetical protein
MDMMQSAAVEAQDAVRRKLQLGALDFSFLFSATSRSPLPVLITTNEPILDVLNSLLNPSQVAVLPYAGQSTSILVA